MFSWKRILKKLDKLDEIGKQLERLTDLVHSDERLRKQNEGLMDRLMSRDWETYAAYSPDVLNKLETVREKKETSPLEDESNIGEILSDEEIS